MGSDCGTDRKPGMDHALYGFSPIAGRKPLRWPGGARVALWVIVYLEDWELDPPPDAVRAPDVQGPWPAIFPDWRTVSHREYGMRVGIFRAFEVLDRLGVRTTAAVSAQACRLYPNLIRECRRLGFEIAAHGTRATRMISSRMSEAEERAAIAEAKAAVVAASGRAPAGWIGQDFGESVRTPALVAEAGFRYIGDWPNDDQPYAMNVRPPLVSLPCHAQWDDVQLLWLRNVAAHRYAEIAAEAFRRIAAEADAGGRLFQLGIHPWILGQSARIRYLDEALRFVVGHAGVWTATGEEIAGAFLAQTRREDVRRTP